MEFMTTLWPFFALLGISIAANCVLATLLTLRRSQKSDPKLTLDAQDLLHDLTTKGKAVVKVEVIDVSNFYLRSPRG